MSADARTIEVSQLEIMATRDGSQTLRDPASGITYRSAYGARTEARHVFVEGTRVLAETGPKQILEIGLGGGTNFLETLAQRAALGIESALTYHAIERAPISPDLAKALHEDGDPARVKGLQVLAKVLARYHAHPQLHLEHHDEATGVTLVLHASEWTKVELDQSFDAVYHDPFGPRVNAEAWSADCFGWIAGHMREHALLATYSAAGAVRRNLASAGLITAWREGAGGKREMTVAAKSRDALSGYQLCPASKQPQGFHP
ncbi:MAG: tRNA (5-methylaminomethyl-2-thiouridine)(34)-methyltransferase MnmD [Myxococcota bacterium]|nr:tRNA (5-methylaminomethyl-2-thiouridine)(34)-methyltransferase MnmD [Myxococcota bacterium]